MKKITIVIALIGINLGMKAQNETVNGNLTVKGNINQNIAGTPSVWYHLIQSNNQNSGFWANNGNPALYLRDTNGNLNVVARPDGKSYFNGGNFGIGTTNPSQDLEIYSSSPVIRLRNSADGTSSYGWLEFNDVNSRMGYVGFGSTSTNHLYIMNETGGDISIPKGNVGIGTTNPSQDLEIYSSSPVIRLRNSADGTSSYGWLEFNDVNSRMGYVGFGSTSTNHLYIMNEAGGDISMPKGNVGIGTTNPGSWKLAVNGKIRAKEIKVETGWSDFVFFDDYQLPTLDEVENHIQENGHLKDIPSAKEVEENGIFLGEMDSKLLQKIEELTLYTIQQQKEIQKLKVQKSQIEKQQNEIEELKSLVKQLLKSKK
ncbi:DUF4200 domain-containing protein [Aquimarina latercula]|uniref:DUF4200 domain-containing protein n=1 Tax=Aquimarina latercula TaxID=987 RepID=UPI0004097437|nr:DUF4200 domain-containing protein [Aquimarina latercula]